MLIHCSSYNTDLSAFGVDKPFALDRGKQVLRALAERDGISPAVLVPESISLAHALMVHTQDYLNRLKQDETWIKILDLSEDDYDPSKARRKLPELLDDIMLKCGGTLLACELALKFDMAANLGGGYHHAFPNEGRGYCVLNDIAIALKSLKRRRMISQALVVDLDFHQGDGTALIFRDDPSVFTFSVHSKEGWPDEKQESDLDIEVPADESQHYLEAVQDGLEDALEMCDPDFVLFVAGSDPYEKDVLPGSQFLQIPLDTMRKRDELVLDRFADEGIPLAMVFAGGYGPDVWEVHYHAVRHLLEKSGALCTA
jgi:acetoin utilization deacetylase AcuC-like enzyme